MVGVDSVKWKKGVVLFHNRTMHVTGNITRGMPKVLAKESKPRGKPTQSFETCTIDRGENADLEPVFSFVFSLFTRTSLANPKD